MAVGTMPLLESVPYVESAASDSDRLLGPLFTRKYNWLWTARKVQRIVVDFTENDHNAFVGGFIILTYLGAWLLGVCVVPIVIILPIWGFYISEGVLVCLIILCYIVPVHPIQSIRKFALRRFGRYFKEASIRFEHVPNPLADRPTIFCINPHGVFSMSWAHCYLTDEFHHVHFCFSSLLRLNPFLRVLTRLTGYPSGVDKDTIIGHLKNRHSIAIIPGAWHEATLHNSSIDRIYIRQRRGFVKYALEYGCTITPTYCFGEKGTYSNIQGCYTFRFWLNDRKMMALVPWGQWLCPFLPKSSARIHTVIGAPLELPHIPHPTAEDVDRWHQVYIEEMSDLYDRYKRQFYGEDATGQILEIW